MTSGAAADEWLQWRGPNGNGTAASVAAPPLRWGPEENVRWRTEVPGRGMSSPVVVDGLVVLTTATEDAQFVLGYDRGSGALRWRTEVHRGGLPEKLHRKNSAATPTPASDGRSLFAVFHNSERIWLTALDAEGGVLWQVDAGPYVCGYRFGYAPSPTIRGETVIVASEHEEEGYLAAFRREDGSEVWRVPRAETTSYSSPIVASVAGRDQLLLSGADKVAAYDPDDGSLLWETEGSCRATCGTMVWSGGLVFASGGFPNRETLAVRADGSGEVVWRNGDKSYEQSLLHHDGLLYAFNDNGILVCWDAATGEEQWKERLGGSVSASPVLAGGRIYAMNEQGETFVFPPGRDGYEQLAVNRLGNEGFATPAFVGDAVYLRTAIHSGEERQEWLYCIGE